VKVAAIDAGVAAPHSCSCSQHSFTPAALARTLRALQRLALVHNVMLLLLLLSMAGCLRCRCAIPAVASPICWNLRGPTKSMS
jgi:hypothetical protein